MSDKELLQLTVGEYCKRIREQGLKLTLTELSDDSGIHYKTLYSFESGLSSNLYIFYIYYNRSSDKKLFLTGLKDELERLG